MKRLAIMLLVLAALVAACSSDSSDDAAPTTTVAAIEEQASAPTTSDATTTTAAATTTEATTTTAAASGDITSCVVGTWELDSQAFFDAIVDTLSADEQPGEFMFEDGAYLLVVEEDGTFQSIRDDWTFSVDAEGEVIQLRMNDVQTGTYSFDGSVLTTRLEGGSPAEIEILIDGVPFELPGGQTPFEPPAAEFEGAVVSCDGDVMTSSSDLDPFSSTWRRVG